MFKEYSLFSLIRISCSTAFFRCRSAVDFETLYTAIYFSNISFLYELVLFENNIEKLFGDVFALTDIEISLLKNVFGDVSSDRYGSMSIIL